MSRVAVMSWMCIFWLAGVVAAQASGQFPYTGRVTGNDVNIRCGPDTNYYPTMRLSTGAAVTVVGEEFGPARQLLPDRQGLCGPGPGWLGGGLVGPCQRAGREHPFVAPPADNAA